MVDEEFDEPKSPKPSFSFEEEKGSAKTVITIYGKKGDGKTTVAFSFPGSKAVLSFDNKSVLVKENYYGNSDNIKVWDCTKYLSPHPTTYTETSATTITYIQQLVKHIEKGSPDWIVIDGFEILSQIAEMAMRRNQGLKPFQGVSNLNVWKERNMIIRDIHISCIRAAKKGLIYTTYTSEEEIINDGVVISKKEIPKWSDAMLWTTDIVIHGYSERGKEGRKFIAEIVSSKKDKMLKTGEVIDMTGKTNIRERK
jgi:hypothetical protein